MMNKKSFRLFMMGAAALFISQNLHAFTIFGTNTDGTIYKRQVNGSGQMSFSWNLETGPMQDGAAIHDFSSMSEFNSYCQNGGDGGGGGGGSCSLSPLLRDAMAQDVSNSEGITLMTNAFNTWTNQANQANINVTQGASLGAAVNICNIDTYAPMFTPVTSSSDPRVCGCLGTCSSACLNPVIFDANGDITGNLIGDRYSVLGATGPIQVPGVNYFQNGFSILNGSCLQPNPLAGCSGFSLSDAEFQETVTHEMGHLMGLDHTLINPDSVINFSVLASGADPNSIPTMYPGYVVPEQANLKMDDQMGLAYLYPKSNFSSSTCTATGTVFNLNNAQALRCAEVVLRDTASSSTLVDNAIGFVSGMVAPNDGNTGRITNTCTGSGDTCGSYTIPGLQVGHTYKVTVNPIPNFTSGSTIGPCSTNPTFSTVTNNGTVTCSSAGQNLTGGALTININAH